MRIQAGGGGGGSIPGVTSDNQTPGGEVIAGALTAGDASATIEPTFHNIYGQAQITDTVGNNRDTDQVFVAIQSAALAADSGAGLALFWRHGALNGHDYTEPVIVVNDSTAGSAPIARWVKQGVPQFQVDADGIRVHGKFKTGSATPHALGAYSGNAVPIYDETGTLLGYMPLYA